MIAAHRIDQVWVGIGVDFTATTEVETIDAGTEVGTILFGTGIREHTQPGFTGATTHTRKMTDISERA